MLAPWTRIPHKALALAHRLPGLAPMVRRARAGSIAIVMYHGVTPEPLPVFNWCQLALTEFERQIEFLAAHYTVLPLREIVRRLDCREALPPNPAAITFDDGFRSVLTAAYPVLKRYSAPATVFLVTSVVGTRQPAWPDRLYHAVATSARKDITFAGQRWELTTPTDRALAYRALAARLKTVPTSDKDASLEYLHERLRVPAEVPSGSPLATMDWEEVERLARSGLIDFGSHTHTHPILSRCEPAMQYTELRASRDLVRERLGRCDLFAYPNGTRADFTAQTRRFLKELRYIAAVSTTMGLNSRRTDRYSLRRVGVGADATLRQFERQMIGL